MIKPALVESHVSIGEEVAWCPGMRVRTLPRVTNMMQRTIICPCWSSKSLERWRQPSASSGVSRFAWQTSQAGTGLCQQQLECQLLSQIGNTRWCHVLSSVCPLLDLQYKRQSWFENRRLWSPVRLESFPYVSLSREASLLQHTENDTVFESDRHTNTSSDCAPWSLSRARIPTWTFPSWTSVSPSVNCE